MGTDDNSYRRYLVTSHWRAFARFAVHRACMRLGIKVTDRNGWMYGYSHNERMQMIRDLAIKELRLESTWQHH